MSDQKDQIKAFIEANLQRSPADLALELSKKKDIPSDYILRQVNGRQKALSKFPFLLEVEDFEFPSAQSVAQASSEQAAKFKVKQFQADIGRMADLSGGMGIDTYFFSKKSEIVDYVEPNQALFELSERNFKCLSAENIECHEQKAENFLKDHAHKYDLIYLDPDRRRSDQRFIQIRDCEPNLIALLPQLFERSSKLMVKYSPLLDIDRAASQLNGLKEVIVLSINNECKELLLLLEKGYESDYLIRAIDLKGENQTELAFKRTEEEETGVTYAEVGKYLYEPNAAIMKAGAFKLVAGRFGLAKIAQHTHLYTSDQSLADFPGRTLKVKQVDKAKKGLIRQANLVNRNSGMKVEELKKKYKIREGGEDFLYACRNENGQRIFIQAEKV